jgi:hypothetical protein
MEELRAAVRKNLEDGTKSYLMEAKLVNDLKDGDHLLLSVLGDVDSNTQQTISTLLIPHSVRLRKAVTNIFCVGPSTVRFSD